MTRRILVRLSKWPEKSPSYDIWHHSQTGGPQTAQQKVTMEFRLGCLFAEIDGISRAGNGRPRQNKWHKIENRFEAPVSIPGILTMRLGKFWNPRGRSTPYNASQFGLKGVNVMRFRNERNSVESHYIRGNSVAQTMVICTNYTGVPGCVDRYSHYNEDL